jgi:hypothetical protein
MILILSDEIKVIVRKQFMKCEYKLTHENVDGYATLIGAILNRYCRL